MFRKSNNSDLSTTFSSTKDSILSTESEQNEITALISTYSIKEDENKYFNKNYALYEIKFFTRYKTWTLYKRYSQFLELRDKLASKKIKNLPKLPPKLYFSNEQKLSERQLGLEDFLNDLFRNVNILRYPEIIEFIQCPKEIIDILSYNIDYLNMNDKNNFYCSLARMNLSNDNDKKNVRTSEYNEEKEITHGGIVIQEFLRNLIDTPYNKTELLYQFEYFLLNRDNEESKSNSSFKWYFLSENEIKTFLNGFYSNISHTKINGFLYHCGNIINNKIASEQCLEFLKKLLNEDYNPQADLFLRVFKKCDINDIIQMELDKHIINNTNSVRIDAFMILYKYIENNKNYEDETKQILRNEKAEKMFLQWIQVEF